MRLATINNDTPDGQLIVVSADGQSYLPSNQPSSLSLLLALENWASAKTYLTNLDSSLKAQETSAAQRLSGKELLAPLPRSFAFLDGSAFLEHVRLARSARGADLPADLTTVPLMYQGISDRFIATNQLVQLVDPTFDLDFEGEFGVITTAVPQGIDAQSALSHIALIILLNDWTYRSLVSRETGSGFGFIQSKPPSSLAPIAVTPDELGTHWRNGRVELNLEVSLNGSIVGGANGREMNFSFGELISHAARTRPLSAGTIIGSGTVSNTDETKGYSCIAEKRAREMIAHKVAATPFLKKGDVIKMNVNLNKTSLFGELSNQII